MSAGADALQSPANESLLKPGCAERSRIVGFSNNVISTALSLLVLEVRVPADLKQLSFHTAVVVLGPRLLSGFCLSCIGIGLAWIHPWLSYAVYAPTPVAFILLQFF